jgi:hypothetical protein
MGLQEQAIGEVKRSEEAIDVRQDGSLDGDRARP